jgi:hypothetical protein
VYPYADNGDTLGAELAGDVLYHDGTNWTNLRKGTNGQHLELTSGIPAWADTSGGASSDSPYAMLQHSKAVASHWRSSPISTASLTGANYLMTADTVYAVPFIIGETDTADRIGIDIITASGSNAMLGIYNSTGGVPDDLLLQAGEIATSGTGDQTITISQSLTPGMYFLAIVADGTPRVNAISKLNALWNYGFSGLSGAASGGPLTLISGAHSYDSGLPDPFPTIAATNDSTPRVSLRF